MRLARVLLSGPMLTKTIRRAFLIVCLFCACAACTREAPTGAADTRRFIPRTDAASFREMLAYPDDDRDVQKNSPR
ncbi:MAG: hypothetical protein M5R36_13740 [Deltaproteobacteria bacterium]|nr:hypothetical protein [Deltaproteobacteria bacterium]